MHNRVSVFLVLMRAADLVIEHCSLFYPICRPHSLNGLDSEVVVVFRIRPESYYFTDKGVHTLIILELMPR